MLRRSIETTALIEICTAIRALLPSLRGFFRTPSSRQARKIPRTRRDHVARNESNRGIPETQSGLAKLESPGWMRLATHWLAVPIAAFVESGFCAIHAENEVWHLCVLEPGDEGGEG